MNLRSVVGSMFAPMLIHGLNQQHAVMRAATAKANGLDPNQYGTPYPGSQVTNTTTNNTKGWLAGAVLGALLLTGGGAGVLGLIHALKPAPLALPSLPSMPALPLPIAPRPNAPADAWDDILEQQQPDGSWKELKRWREGQPLPNLLKGK